MKERGGDAVFDRNIIIGNAISLVAAIFTVVSAVSRGRKKIYGYQAIQCFVMAIASVFFGSMSGVATFILCAARNMMAAYDRFTKRACITFAILVTVIGVLSNNTGLTGLIPVVTTVIYTVGSWKLKREIPIKLNAALNLTLWAGYDLIICDLVSLAIDTVCAVLTVASAIRIAKHTKADEPANGRVNS